MGGDFIVAIYADSGFNRGISISDGKATLGTTVQNTAEVESDQSYLLTTVAGVQSATFTISGSSQAVVVLAAFTPIN